MGYAWNGIETNVVFQLIQSIVSANLLLCELNQQKSNYGLNRLIDRIGSNIAFKSN